MWGVVAAMAVAAAIGGLIYLFWGGESAATKHAKAMEEVRKQHDETRKAGEQYADSLEKLSQKEALSAAEKEQAKRLIADLQEANRNLGKSTEELGIAYDEATGSIMGADKALALFRENARQSAIADLKNEGDALAAQYDELRSKIHMDGNVGTWRAIGTWVSFGYMDNEDEIRQKMTDLEKKKSENATSMSKAMDYSDEYKERAKKLEEFYEKDTELARNAYAQKVADIQKEFSERETILRQLIAEQEARQDLTIAEREQLKERKEGLKGLNDLQRQRIELLKEEERRNLEKIKTDFERKRAENVEKKKWNERLEASPEDAAAEAQKQSAKADKAFYVAIAAREAAIGNETLTEKQRKQLDDAVETAKTNAEKWKGRTEEAGKAVDEKAKKEEKESANREKEVGNVATERQNREKRRAKEEEEKAWKETAEADPAAAQAKAQSEYANSQKGLNEAYEKWKQLIRDGAAAEVIDAQKTLVNDMEDNIDLWRKRADEVAIKEIDERKEIQSRDYQMPATLMAGSVDAQKKFIENQQNMRNGMEQQQARTNSILEGMASDIEDLKDNEGV
ncbi:MAG: hypothetical protein Q4D98_03580 [Planctomycetia bacterium]|nr:hypothetical protein [Planctomycetia bacterium]